jgi:hypothetical protein
MPTLSDLLATAKAQIELKAAEAKAKVKKTSSPARSAAVAEHLALTVTLDWTPIYRVYRQEVWRCDCGHAGLAPDGLYILHEHRRLANTTRLVRQGRGSTDYEDLPARVLAEPTAVHICPACTDEHGYLRPYNPPLSMARAVRPLPKDRTHYANEWATLTAPESERAHPTETE